MNELSRMQRKVYDRLCDFKSRTGKCPEPADLARELGIHYVSLRQHLTALDKKGFIVFKSRGTGQSPIMELPLQATGVPVLGSIPAGSLSEAAAEAEGFLPLNYSRNYFALRVNGDSMADLIQHNDVVLFKQGLPTHSGEICAVRVGSNEVTLKYVDLLDGGKTLALRPHNPSYPTVSVSAQEVHIEGLYQGLMRGELIKAFFQEVS